MHTQKSDLLRPVHTCNRTPNRTVWTAPRTEHHNKTCSMFCSGLLRRDGGICPSHQSDVRVRPEQVWTVRRTRTQTRNTTAPVSTHKPIDFQIKMYSLFNTISDWFMVNSLSLNLKKTFHGIKVFRMHKYILHIMVSYKKKKRII
jgi:hypothetical protein